MSQPACHTPPLSFCACDKTVGITNYSSWLDIAVTWSFIERRNKNCPKIESFGTPCFMEVKKEVSPPQLATWDQLFKYYVTIWKTPPSLHICQALWEQYCEKHNQSLVTSHKAKLRLFSWLQTILKVQDSWHNLRSGFCCPTNCYFWFVKRFRWKVTNIGITNIYFLTEWSINLSFCKVPKYLLITRHWLQEVLQYRTYWNTYYPNRCSCFRTRLLDINLSCEKRFPFCIVLRYQSTQSVSGMSQLSRHTSPLSLVDVTMYCQCYTCRFLLLGETNVFVS